MSSPNPSLVLVDHYIHHSSTTHTIPAASSTGDQHQQQPMTTMVDLREPLKTYLKRTLAASDGNHHTIAASSLGGNPMAVAVAGTKGGGRRQQPNKKPKIQHPQHQHQHPLPAQPLAPRLIAPLQARPRCCFASGFAGGLGKEVETIMATTSSAANNTNNTICMPPMPTNPHEIAREAMRITQEAMKKQKLQELELQKQQQQQSSSSSSTMLLLSPPPPLQIQQQSGGTFPSTTATTTNKTGANITNNSTLPTTTSTTTATGHVRLNKFVRRLHDMLRAEKNGGIVEWRRRGLLVLHDTHVFSKTILPKFFNTKNFKTFRRQLNYYGFVHVRSFSNTTQPSTTTALWVHQELAASAQQPHQQQVSSSSCSSSSQGSAAENHAHHHAHDNNNSNDAAADDDEDDIAAVLQLRRVEACDAGAAPKTAEGRRHRKEQAIHTVEEDLGVNAKTLQMEHIQSLLVRGGCSSSSATATTMSAFGVVDDNNSAPPPPPPTTSTTTTTLMTGAIVQKAGAATFTKAPLARTAPRSNTKNATTTTSAAAATPITSLQRLQPLLPAVPLEISVPRSGSSSAASLDQEATQGAANLLLLLSKAVSSY